MRLVERLFAGAAQHPERPFLRMTASTHTYAQAATDVRRVAGGLRELGVSKACAVGLLMGNSPEQVITTFAVAQLGAVAVPLNTDLVGDFLADPLAVAGCRYVVVDAERLDPLRAVLGGLSDVHTIVVAGHHRLSDDVESTPRHVPYQDVAAAAPLDNVAAAGELEAATILFTSGTTGRSKGCVLSHRYAARQAENHVKYLQLQPEDVMYSPFPLFHIDAAILTVGAAVVAGGTAAVGTRFSVSGFWDEVRAFDATVLNFMGATLTLLWNLPPHGEDRRHRLRLGWGVPMPSWSHGWRERYGFGLYEMYGLTDGGVVCYDPYPVGRRDGACGRVIPEFDVAIADDAGELLPVGERGEILIRPREAGTVMTEYAGMPAATAEAFRGLWLHTGDSGRVDEDGFLYFEGRTKDSVRRRGENISLAEVETLMASHPDVLEVAAVGVPSELAEEDLKVCVVLREESGSSPAELAAYFEERAPRFMVPRYVELMTALPKTPTQKVERFRLRDSGVTPHTWDRESVSRGSSV